MVKKLSLGDAFLKILVPSMFTITIASHCFLSFDLLFLFWWSRSQTQSIHYEILNHNSSMHHVRDQKQKWWHLKWTKDYYYNNIKYPFRSCLTHEFKIELKSFKGLVMFRIHFNPTQELSGRTVLYNKSFIMIFLSFCSALLSFLLWSIHSVP